MKREPKRRFLGLTVGEVSLVDVPANESDFVVLKNQEETDMNAKAQEGTVAKNVAERVAVETGEESSPDVTKALSHVASIVADIVKAVTPTSAATESETGTEKGKKAKAPPFGADDDDGDEKSKKGSTVRAAMKKALGAGVPDEAFEGVMTMLKAAGLDPDEKFQNKQPPVAKSAGETAEEQSALTMETLVSAITKAKAFTPDRVAKLKSAAEALKMLLEDVGMGSVPATSTPGLKTSPSSEVAAVGTQGEGVMKALEPLVDAVKSLTAKVGELDGKVEAIQKAKPAPEGGGEGGTVVKTEKSNFWKGAV